MFDELVNIRINQEKTHRGMLTFQNCFMNMGEKVSEVIHVTNKNTDMLKTLAYKSIDLEARSRRNNLIFWGLVENRNENCFALIRQFIKNELNLDADRMYLARAHRLGPVKIGQQGLRKRPIIVNFRDFCDTEAIMRNAYMLRRTSFSVDYDFPKEISTARKLLWNEVKSIKSRKPTARCQIVYPAKLIVDGKVVRDEFPNWNEIRNGNRLGDFIHIDQQAFTCDLTEHDRHSAMDTHVYDHSDFEREDDFSRYREANGLSDQNPYSPLSSQANMQVINVNTEAVSSPRQTPTRVDNHNDLHSEATVSHEDSSEKCAPQNPFFRPFNTDTEHTDQEHSRNASPNNRPTLEFPKRAEHVSRTKQRGVRRSQSVSVPRSSQVIMRGTSPVKTQVKNKQSSGQNNSVSRENSSTKETVTPQGAKNSETAEKTVINSQPSTNTQNIC